MKKEREVNFVDSQIFAKTWNMFYMETSAKNSINVTEAFVMIAKLGMAREFRNIAYQQSTISPQNEHVDLVLNTEEPKLSDKLLHTCCSS